MSPSPMVAWTTMMQRRDVPSHSLPEQVMSSCSFPIRSPWSLRIRRGLPEMAYLELMMRLSTSQTPGMSTTPSCHSPLAS
jgi:hypothetical protein